MSSNPCIYIEFGDGDHCNGRLELHVAVRLQIKVRVLLHGFGTMLMLCKMFVRHFVHTFEKC